MESREAALEEAGDLLIPITAGLIMRDHTYVELGELVSGKKPGRTTDGEITLFKSVGLAIEDISVAKLVYDRARASGIGTDLPL